MSEVGRTAETSAIGIAGNQTAQPDVVSGEKGQAAATASPPNEEPASESASNENIPIFPKAPKANEIPIKANQVSHSVHSRKGGFLTTYPLIIRTVTGPIWSRQGTLWFVPAATTWQLLQELHRISLGQSNRFALDLPSQPNPRAARLAFRSTLANVFGQIMVAPDTARMELFASLCDFVEQAGSLDGLESVYLTGLRLAAASGLRDIFDARASLAKRLGLPKYPGGGLSGFPVFNGTTNVIEILGLDWPGNIGQSGGFDFNSFGGVGDLGKTGNLGSASGLWDLGDFSDFGGGDLGGIGAIGHVKGPSLNLGGGEDAEGGGDWGKFLQGMCVAAFAVGGEVLGKEIGAGSTGSSLGKMLGREICPDISADRKPQPEQTPQSGENAPDTGVSDEDPNEQPSGDPDSTAYPNPNDDTVPNGVSRTEALAVLKLVLGSIVNSSHQPSDRPGDVGAGFGSPGGKGGSAISSDEIRKTDGVTDPSPEDAGRLTRTDLRSAGIRKVLESPYRGPSDRPGDVGAGFGGPGEGGGSEGDSEGGPVIPPNEGGDPTARMGTPVPTSTLLMGPGLQSLITRVGTGSFIIQGLPRLAEDGTIIQLGLLAADRALISHHTHS